MKKLLILGAGELGCQIVHYARLDGRYEIVGFLDDTISNGTLVNDVPVIGDMKDFCLLYKRKIYDCVFIGIGYDHFDFKEKLYNSIVLSEIPLATIISPQVYIDPTASIGNGVILYPGSLVEKDAIVEDNAVINIHTTIAHNARVGKHSFVAGGAVLAGYASIGMNCFIGVNSVVNDHINICDNVVVGSLTVVSKNIKNPGLYFNDNRRLFKF